MGYPSIGKVKTIVLPCLGSGAPLMTIESYKEKFGIDLRDILAIIDGRIVAHTNAQILLYPNPRPTVSEDETYSIFLASPNYMEITLNE